MKALFAAALIAVAPMAASAAVVTIDDVETLDAGIAPGSTTYTFAKALDNVVFYLSSPFGALTFSIPGLVGETTISKAVTEFSLGDFAVNDSFTVVYSSKASYSVTITGDVPAPVPVPAAGLLAMGGIASLAALRARRKKA